MGKKRMCLAFIVVLTSVLLIAGCGLKGEIEDSDVNKKNVQAENEKGVKENSQAEPLKYKKLEDVPKVFSLQEAKDAGMMVLEGMEVTSGLTEWNEFLANVWSGEADEIMIATYYELDDPSNYSIEYYEEIKADYPVIYIFLLVYDGNTYTLSHYEGEQIHKYEYDYLIERTGQMSSNAAMADHFFALVNDKELSYHDITWSLLSSQSTDWVDFNYVFNESISLRDYFSTRPGVYETDDGLASLTLDENCEFRFNRFVATSYDPGGRYYVEGDSLVLHVNEEEEYIFKIMGDGVLEFVSGESAEGLVRVGTKFIYEGN